VIGFQRRQPQLQAGQRRKAHNAVKPSVSNRC
jgi:hypothetical protein